MAGENPDPFPTPEEAALQAAAEARGLMMEALQILDRLQMSHPAVLLCHSIEILSETLDDGSSIKTRLMPPASPAGHSGE